MAWRDRLGRWPRIGQSGPGSQADSSHLESFVSSRRGVEGFVEPQTNTTPTTLVLVAADGEWTRRRVASRAAGFALGRRLAIPVYDVAATGYPPRMRQWSSQRRASGQEGSTHG